MALIGLGWLLSSSIPWLGRLPGDVVVERENFRFYFPVTTCIVFSLLFTAIMRIIRYFGK